MHRDPATPARLGSAWPDRLTQHQRWAISRMRRPWVLPRPLQTHGPRPLETEQTDIPHRQRRPIRSPTVIQQPQRRREPAIRCEKTRLFVKASRVVFAAIRSPRPSAYRLHEISPTTAPPRVRSLWIPALLLHPEPLRHRFSVGLPDHPFPRGGSFRELPRFTEPLPRRPLPQRRLLALFLHGKLPKK